MAANRGFYNPRSEDHATLALFHTFSTFASPNWAHAILGCLNIDVPPLNRVRFAYACEEILDDRLASRHGRNFIIADIIMHWEDIRGELGILAFEVKKPLGPIPDVKDLTKVQSYADLPSMQDIKSRHYCFLVDRSHEPALRRSGYPVITWDDILRIQLEALKEERLETHAESAIKGHLLDHFANFGIGGNKNPPQVRAYPLKEVFDRVGQMKLRPEIGALMCGFAICSNRRAGAPIAEVPFPWLTHENDISKIRTSKFQSTPERRVNRWSFNWKTSQERRWP